ncbi:DUF3172 domain-containing protein [Spirulina subsalsa FACHB-351]|uniref:DUF3172 domain-containing protein n=1 Tax=Spirulina subsalsa FACHB-351 TaxID=234711 RepID=A0ABT3L9H7_9CYAN|nr:DUF3172 domain-containing protein [Spirulina subsalsa]MCW6038149.1 DUF3172 domain-containing protein [Spirulina subsalsa FACHB-351]
MKRRTTPPYQRGYNSGYSRGYDTPPPPRPPGKEGGGFLSGLNYGMLALLAGVFIVGVGLGMTLSITSSTNNVANVATREVIDRSAPDAALCQQFGASAIVTDMRVFLTLNPFNVYVTQPQMTPGCVLRRNNWSILEQRKLVTDQSVRDCKNRMNTFGFTGTLDGGSPRISCIYQNDAAGNLFLNKPGTVDVQVPSETNQF